MKTKLTSFKLVVFGAVLLCLVFPQQILAQRATQNQNDLVVGQTYGPGTIYQRLLNVVVTTTEANVVINELQFTLTNPEQIDRVSLFRSDNSIPDFTNTTILFGTPIIDPTGTITFTGTYTQVATSNKLSFYMLVDIKPTATVGTTIDATCSSVNTSVGTYIAGTGNGFLNSGIEMSRNAVIADNLTGTKTVKETGGDFTNLNAAIIALNNLGVGEGGVTFELANGEPFAHTSISFTQNLIRQTGTATKPIVIKRSATNTHLAKPIINCPATGSSSDCIIGAVGVDYLTIDGLDLRATLTTSSTRFERPVYFLGSNKKGCSYNEIKNCVIDAGETFNNNRIIAIGFVSKATQAEGANNFNKIHHNTISNVDAAVDFNYGVPTPLPFHDDGNEIYNNMITGQFATELGGLRVAYCKNTKIYNNTLDGAGVTTTYDGDRHGIITSSTTNLGYVHIYGNVIKNLAINKARNLRGIHAIAPTVLIYNNVVSNLTNSFALTAAKDITGISMTTDGASTTILPDYYLYHNSVYLNQTVTNSFQITAAVANAGGLGLTGMTLINNVFVNASVTGTPEKNFALYIPNRTLSYVKAETNNNLYYGTDVSATYIKLTSPATPYATLAAYKAASIAVSGMANRELNSVSADPLFVDAAGNELHITDALSPTSNTGTTVAAVTVDINGNPRHATKPDLGAYEDAHAPVSTLIADLLNKQHIIYSVNGAIVAKISEAATVSVIDAKGSVLYKNTVNAQTLSIPVSQKGLYIIRIQNKNENTTNKVLVL